LWHKKRRLENANAVNWLSPVFIPVALSVPTWFAARSASHGSGTSPPSDSGSHSPHAERFSWHGNREIVIGLKGKSTENHGFYHSI
jgi:hypothetical protein